MPNHNDRFIFTTGVVGRAMGSGKFEAEHIKHLTQTAYDAFNEIFGEPSEAPAATAAPYRQASHVGAVAQQVVAAAGVSPETAPFNMWGGDKAYLGWKDNKFEGQPEPEVCWGVWQAAAAEGNERARGVLEKAAAADPAKGDPKWHAANRKRIARAKACLAMLK